MIPPLSLASDPANKIILKHATVADMIDFAGVDIGHEEELTSIFLNRLQDKETYSDAKLWTAEDRRLALFWYWLHTTKDYEQPLTYDCGHCGTQHTFLFDYRKLSDGYQTIKGKPERDFEFQGDAVVVRPLDGNDMEILEAMRLELDAIREEQGTGSGAYHRQDALMQITRLQAATDYPREKIMALEADQFLEFAGMVYLALEDMTHGLESKYDNGRISLLIPPHQCPNVKDREATTRLWVFFRNSDYIPQLF